MNRPDPISRRALLRGGAMVGPQAKIEWTRPSAEETARMRKLLAEKQK